MKIGILVNESKSIFTNGCLQQGYFLLKSFRNIENVECQFVTADSNFNKFEVVNEDIISLKSSSDLDNFHHILHPVINKNLCLGSFGLVEKQ